MYPIVDGRVCYTALFGSSLKEMEMKMNGLMRYVLCGVTSLVLAGGENSSAASSNMLSIFAGVTVGDMSGWSNMDCNDKPAGVDITGSDADSNFDAKTGTYSRSSKNSFTSHSPYIGANLMVTFDDIMPYFSLGARVGFGYIFGGKFGSNPLGNTGVPPKSNDVSSTSYFSVSGGLNGFFVEPQIVIGAEIFDIHTLLCVGWFFSQQNYEMNLNVEEGSLGSVLGTKPGKWVNGFSGGIICTFRVGPCTAGALQIGYKYPGLVVSDDSKKETNYALSAHVLDIGGSLLVEVPVN